MTPLIPRRPSILILACAIGTLAGCRDGTRTDAVSRPLTAAEAAAGPRAAAADVHRLGRGDGGVVRKRLNRVLGGVRGKYIVVLEDGAGSGAAGAAAAGSRPAEVSTRLAARHAFRRKHVYERGVRGFSADMSEAAAAALARDPDVAYVIEDVRAELNATQSDPPWGLDRIGQRNLPLNGWYSTDQAGRGVHVYVIDSGVLPEHEDLIGRVSLDVDFMDDGQNGRDCLGHGTHVAGTIAGKKYGVAKEARVHALRVFDCSGYGLVSDDMAALEWVIANHVKPAVVNMSLGSQVVPVFDQVVRNTVAAGVTVVVSSGNSFGYAEDKSPARVQEAITVGASDLHDTRAWFSNFGRVVDLYAPGNQVMSSWYTSANAAVMLSGTSMAAPHVAGVAALYLEINPTATPAAVEAALVSSSTRGVLRDTGPGAPNRLVNSSLAAPAPRPALLVVHSTTLSASDAALQARLQARGFSVTTRSAGALVSADANGKAVVVVSSSVTSTQVGSKLTAVTTPVVSLEAYLFDDLKLTGPTFGTDYGETTGPDLLEIRDDANPLSGGLRGSDASGGWDHIVSASSAGKRWWGVPSAGATGLDGRPVTLQGNPGRAAVFGYEKGAAMVGLVAPARRVGLFADGETVSTFTAEGWALFDGAVEWATSPNPDGGPANDSLSPAAEPGRVTLRWHTSHSNLRHDIHRATRSGGPYTRIGTIQEPGFPDGEEGWGHEWVDQNVTNGQTYYYIVEPFDANGLPGRTTFERQARLAVPQAPNDVEFVRSPGALTLMCSKEPFGSYEIKRADTSGGPYTVLATVTPEPWQAYMTYTDTTLLPNRSYSYIITPSNAFGVGPSTEPMDIGTEVQAPGGPITGLQVTELPRGFRLTWDHQPGVPNYHVEFFHPAYPGWAYQVATTTEPDLTAWLPCCVEYRIVVNAGNGPSTELFRSPRTGSALLVVGTLPLRPGEQALASRLEVLGYTVTSRLSADLTTADATGKDVVVISSTARPAEVGTKLTGVTVPVVTMEPFTLPALQLTGSTHGTSFGVLGNQTALVVDPAQPHELAAGSPRTSATSTVPGNFGWGVPGAGAIAIGRSQKATPVSGVTARTVFGYERGKPLVGGLAAPARRLAFLLDADTFGGLTLEGRGLFDAAIRWAVDPAAGDPAAPAGLTATQSGSQVNLSWSAVPGASSYVLLRARRPTAPPQPGLSPYLPSIGINVTGTSFVDTDPVPGARYVYHVQSVGPTGGSGPSTGASGGVGAAPSRPLITASGLPGAVRLNIQLLEPAQSLRVLRATESGGPYVTVASNVDPLSSSYTDGGRTDGTYYYYLVEAVNASGFTRSVEAYAVPGPALVAPAGLTAAPRNGQVTLSWSPVAGARAYRVGRSADGTSPAQEIVIAETTVTSVTDHILTNGNWHTYFVNALGGPGVEGPVAAVATAPRGKVLFVRAEPRGTADTAIRDRLVGIGFDVTERSESALVAADASGMDLVVVSGSVASGTLGSKLTNVATPVLSMEAFVFDDMMMTGPVSGTDHGSLTGQTQVNLVDETHPMARGLSGLRNACTGAATYNWGVPGPGAVLVGQLAQGTRASIFGYQTGAAMVGLVAPARRVGLFVDTIAATSFTPDGRSLFDAAVYWAAGY